MIASCLVIEVGEMSKKNRKKETFSCEQISYNLDQLDTLSSLDGALGAEEVMSQARDLFDQMKEIGDRLSSAYDDLLQVQTDQS